MNESTTRILAEWNGHTVHVNSLSPLPGRVLVQTVDGTKPYSKYYAGAGCSSDSDGCVFIDSLENIRVVEDSQDPFQPDDCQPEPEWEYDPALEWQQMTSELRRGEG